jgi:murein tripeptide amidase MpaA
MVEGIIKFLLSGSEEAEYLLNNYVFRIVPMVNIDGVVHGNTRAELSGCDSNRKWKDPHKLYQPVIYSIKKMI